MFPFFQQLAMHLLVDHVSREIDKKELAVVTPTPPPAAVSGRRRVGSARRARMRRAIMKAQILDELMQEE